MPMLFVFLDMYSEPEWSQATSKSGFLEVLKNGKIFETIPIPLGTRFLSFGRLPENNVALEHESISRKHAVLQFGPRNTAFIFDLSSTHGTFLNKNQIPSSQYIKFTSGNDMIQFGASSRLFLLNLVEDDSDETLPSTSSISSNHKNYRALVSKFFDSHGISSKSIAFFQKGNTSSCHFDFSDYISIDSSEQSSINSSGATKSEAYENFYEDSFNFLSRLGLIENEHHSDRDDDYSESDASNNEFSSGIRSKRLKDIKSAEALSEEQILCSWNHFKLEAETIKKEILTLEEKLKVLDEEIVDDFDVYIQDLKKTELKKDIEKRVHSLEFAEKEYLKYEKILSLIGFQKNCLPIREPESISEVNVSEVDDIPENKFEGSNNSKCKSSKVSKIESTQSKTKHVPESETIEENEFENIAQSEDSTVNEEQVDLIKLKRKYGY